MDSIYRLPTISPISMTTTDYATSIANGHLFSLSKFKNLNNYSLKLRCSKSRNACVVIKAVAGADDTTKNDNKEPVKPVYSPTPSNRPLRTPHSGYHFDGSTRKFFEGWFFKVSIPECGQSFCFMYSVESPSFTKKLSTFEELQHGPRFTGVGAQILGADDKYICQYSEESSNFWGSMFLLFLYYSCYCELAISPCYSHVSPYIEMDDLISSHA
ncbi:transcription factor R2R3-MYB [Capsicum annuum]|nr:transcription factor R2R3-MYB [Capsicum annuum]